jgi:hypothetical protein
MENKKIDKIIEAFRNYINLKEDGVISGPTNNVGSGNIAGTPQTDHGNPPVDLRRRKERKLNPFFKKLIQMQRRNNSK